MAKEMTEMPTEDLETLMSAECLTIDRVSEINEMVKKCVTLEATLRLDDIRLRLLQRAKRKR